MKDRLSNIDLWKFIASIFIMIHHLYIFGEPFNSDYYGRMAWIYVEFFFMLTGYFTYKHFAKQNNCSSVFKSGLKYTYQKFKPFLPYTTLAITMQYIVSAPFSYLKNGNIYDFFYHFLNYPFEVLLIGIAFRPLQLLIPVWFLSSMLFVFPVITFLCQLKDKYLLLFISTIYPVIYYAKTQLSSPIWPNNILRALAGMLTGISVCIISEIIKEKNIIKKKPNIMITSVEVVSMSFVLLTVILNFNSLTKLILIAFVLGIGAMLSGYSISSKLNNKFVSLLGKLSMPIFIWHWLVATIICEINQHFSLSVPLKLSIYFAGTIIISTVSYCIIEYIKLKHSKNAQIFSYHRKY